MQSWRTNPLAFDLMRAAPVPACAAVAVFFAAVFLNRRHCDHRHHHGSNRFRFGR
jgi:hypothetical protein